MAGAGAKKFPAFSKLASADVNDYLADQVIMRFATTTARDAAFGGLGEPTLAEGMTAYIDADNSIYTYDGSNWVKMVSATTPVGLELIKMGTVSAQTTLNIDNCFNSDFQNYKIVVSMRGTSNTNALYFRVLDSAGSTLSTNYSGTVYSLDYANQGTTFNVDGVGSAFGAGWLPNSTSRVVTSTIDIYNPFDSTLQTAITGNHAGIATGTQTRGGFVLGNRTTAEQNRGITFFNSLGTNMTGTVRVYGYRD
jgi:hypothetical protein